MTITIERLRKIAKELDVGEGEVKMIDYNEVSRFLDWVEGELEKEDKN